MEQEDERYISPMIVRGILALVNKNLMEIYSTKLEKLSRKNIATANPESMKQ